MDDVKPPQPTQPKPVSDVLPANNPAPVDSSTELAIEPNAPQPEVATSLESVAPVPPPKHHSKGPVLAISLAVVLAGVFGVFAVFAYKQSAKDGSTTSTPAVSQQAAQDKMAPTDVDETNAAVDQSLTTVDDAADYDSNSLNDTSLGL